LSPATRSRWLVLTGLLLWATTGCSTDCDDAIGKLGVCELPLPAALGGECNDETVLACQARCVRATSCEQLAQSMAGQETHFDVCAKTCGGANILQSGSGGDGGSGGGAAGGGGAAVGTGGAEQ
jgi:hypothetical protein